MSTQYNKIIESQTEPSTNNLWLKDGKLYYYKGGWKPLTQEENVSTEDLKLLISEYVDGRQAIATALTNRRYPTEPSESFHAMADKITNMSYQDSWFARIGYTDENDGGIQEAIDYSYDLAKTWNPDGSTAQMFRGNTKLVFAPIVNTSQCSSLENMFNGCTALSIVPQFDTSKAINMAYMFTASNIVEVPLIDTSKATNMTYIFSNCKELKKVPLLDFSSIKTALAGPLAKCAKLLFINMKNLGKSTLTSYDFSGATVWGTGSEENRQSLIDSLITYSYDRASNGMATATIKLSANTKALLTEEEIAQITAKGFTIA